MSEITVQPGDSASFSKTIGEADIYLFAGITGDLGPNHVNEEFMKGTSYGARIAHGVLLLGFASTATTAFLESSERNGVSYGYNRVRFTAPVFIGDTINVDYVFREYDEEANRGYSDVTVRNQSGEVCLVAEHVLAFF